jgi:hypothetical protein
MRPLKGGGLRFENAKSKDCQSRCSTAYRRAVLTALSRSGVRSAHPFESHPASFWPDEHAANLKTEDVTVLTSRVGGKLSKGAAPNSGSVLWQKCSTI